MRKMDTLFFDIEAGGLSGRDSSIFSISTRLDKQTKNYYAMPEEGTFVGKWSEKNVWEPIKSKGPFQSEKDMISSFTKDLNALPEKSTLAGWNIGYRAAPQRSGKGFDLPMLYERAKKYGLEGDLREAVSRHQVRDIGREFSYKIAQEVVAAEKAGNLVQSGAIEESLYKQVEGFVSSAAHMRAEAPLRSNRDIVRGLTEAGKQVSGWKQEDIYKQLFGSGYSAHIAEEDVGALSQLKGFLDSNKKIFKSEADVIKWARTSSKNKLIASIMHSDNAYSSIQEAAVKAMDMEIKHPAYKGFVKEFTESLDQRMKNIGIPKIEGGGLLKETVLPVGKGGVISQAEKVGEASVLDKIKGNRVVQAGQEFFGTKTGRTLIGVTAAALAWNIFSASDDEYNTIEGMDERGMAAQRRKILTSFGSGWRGLPAELMGQQINADILNYRAETINNPSRYRSVQRTIEQKQAEFQAGLGQFSSEDLMDIGTRTITALNMRMRDLKRVRLEKFIIEVEDADSLILRPKNDPFGKPIHIRMAGIDAPETADHSGDPLSDVRIWQNQPGGSQSTERLAELVRNNPDALNLYVSTGRKTYGRYLGVLGTKGGTNINLELARSGMVKALPFGDTKTDLINRGAIARAESEAVKNRRGMWQYKFYQAMKITDKAIGRPITNNTITRIDKLAQNLNLGAYGSFLQDQGQEVGELSQEERLKAYRIGRTLRKTHGSSRYRKYSTKNSGSKKSSSSDNGSYFSGMPHSGIAPMLRKAITDFGSPWRGPVSAVSRTTQKAIKEIANIATEAREVSLSVPKFLPPAEISVLKEIPLQASSVPRLPKYRMQIPTLEGAVSSRPRPLLSLDISGDVRSYNSISGMNESGMASINRKQFGFGSPNQGLSFLSSMLEKYFNTTFRETVASLAVKNKGDVAEIGSKAFQRQLGIVNNVMDQQVIGAMTGTKQSLTDEFIPRMRELLGDNASLNMTEELKALASFEKQVTSSVSEHVVVLNKAGLSKIAKSRGIPLDAAVAGTMIHGRFHQLLRITGLKNKVSQLPELATAEWKASRYGRGYAKAFKSGKLKSLNEEFLASTIEHKLLQTMKKKSTDPSAWKNFKDTSDLFSGFLEKTESGIISELAKSSAGEHMFNVGKLAETRKLVHAQLQKLKNAGTLRKTNAYMRQVSTGAGRLHSRSANSPMIKR